MLIYLSLRNGGLLIFRFGELTRSMTPHPF